MASISEQIDDASPESRALRQCYCDLVKAIHAADTLEIASQLYSKSLVELETVEECGLQTTSFQKSVKIVIAVTKTVSVSPHLFGSLLSVLNESGNAALESVEEKLKQNYESLMELLTEKPCDSHSFHSLSHCPLVTPPQTQSPICRYADYLRAVYKQSEYSNPACYKWMRSPSEEFRFVNLAVISKERISKGEEEKIKNEAITGHIDLILKKKAPIAIENILQVERRCPLTCVLIEGAPGVGKSTLSSELCRRWGRGELFQEYSIVLLVTLRDERVQRATCIVDLFYHSSKKLQEEVVQEIGDSKGKGTLILLEGLDELPRQLLTGYSIFTDLLSGVTFPEATVLVTSRPSATDKLWQKWWQKISRHIEILGFTEDNIDEYTRNVLSDHQLLDFYNYLSIHPYIKSMMYVPLHCAVAIAVYLLCQQSDRPPPKTLTGLYKCLAETILTQYLQDHPDYKDDNYRFNDFPELPSPIYSNFKQLCSLAFDGVDKQQLVFRNLPLSLDLPLPFDHLGFMNVVPERFLQSSSYSYNFLHLSVQEYLAAYHVSLMSQHEQEQLLQTVRYGDHRFNMVRFLAGITGLKHLNKKVVKEVIGITEDYHKQRENVRRVTGYALEFLYECQDMRILDSTECYYSKIEATDSVHRLSSLGYCITMSNSTWCLTFSGRDSSGTEVLCHSLEENTQPTYSIADIEIQSCTLNFTERILQHFPKYALENIEKFLVQHDSVQTLPPCLPEIIPRMKTLNGLTLNDVLSTSLMKVVPALSRVSTLRNLLMSDKECKFEMLIPAEDRSMLIPAEDRSMLIPAEDRLMLIPAKDRFTGTVKSNNFAAEFLDQLLPALPQQSIAYINSLTINCNEQSLPLCLLELVPKMRNLDSLTFTTVLDAILTALMSKIPITRSLTLHITLGILEAPFYAHQMHSRESFTYGPSPYEDQCTCMCNTPETIEQLLQFLPKHHIAEIHSFKVNFNTPKPLPPCVSILISHMVKLKTLELENVLINTLIPELAILPSLKNMRLSSSAFLVQLWSDLIQTRKPKYMRDMTLVFYEQFIDTIQCHNCTKEFIDHILSQTSQQSIAQAKTLSIRNSYNNPQPLPCFMRAIPMENLKLHTLTLENVVPSSLIELMPALSRIPNLKNVRLLNSGFLIQLQKQVRETIDITFCDRFVETIKCQNCTAEFIDHILSHMTQQSILQAKTLSICNSYDNPQPLPCFFEVIPRMETLNSLTLEYVLDTSLTALTPTVSRVTTLRNLKINTKTETFEMLFPTEKLYPAGTITSTSKFIHKFLTQLPHQILAHIRSLTVVCMQTMIEHTFSLIKKDPQPLPRCMLELVPIMERLDSLTLEVVLDATLKALMPKLSVIPVTTDNMSLKVTLLPIVPVPKNLLLNAGGVSEVEMFTFGTSKNTCTCTCTTPKVIDKLLQFFPKQHMAQIQSFHVDYFTSKPLPPCLPQLIPTMERLDTLTLTNVDTSLTKLIPALTRIPTLRNLTLCKSIAKSLSFLGSLPATVRSTEYNVIINFCNSSIAVIECQYRTTTSIGEFLKLLPPHFIAQVKTFKMSGIKVKRKDNEDEDEDVDKDEEENKDKDSYEFAYSDEFEYSDDDEDSEEDEHEYIREPVQEEDKDNKMHVACQPLSTTLRLPELLPRMERLNKLMLESVFGTSLTELLPALSSVPTLKNLTLPKQNSESIVLFCQWLHMSAFQLEELTICDSVTQKLTITFCSNSIETIKYHHRTPELINQILSLLPQQLIVKVKTYSEIHILDYFYDEDDSYSHSLLLPLPSCLFQHIPRMERLNTLTLKNVDNDSLEKLILSLSRLPTLRNLTLSKLDSECIACLCQWLPTCQLETLMLPSFSPNHIKIVSDALGAVSSLKALHINKDTTVWSDFTFQSMQAFVSMLQQNQSLAEVSITRWNFNSDTVCCLAEALHHNTTLTKLTLNRIGERGALAMAAMLKCNATLESLNLSKMYFSKDCNKDNMIKVLVESLAINKHLEKLVLPRRFEKLISTFPLYDSHKERVLLNN